ncbi:MAG: hypothetical protein ABI847_11345 [Anaerolineales bacterium]
MKPRFWLPIVGLLVASCSPVVPGPEGAVANTEVIQVAIATGIAGTLAADAQTKTAGAPTVTATSTATLSPTPTATSTSTLPATPTSAPTATLVPSATSTVTQRPANLAPPTATQLPAASAVPTPDFVTAALDVRAHIDEYGWQIDQGRGRVIFCQPLVNAYDYVVAHRTLTVPDSLGGPYQLYTAGVESFISNAEALTLNCKAFLTDTVNYHAASSQQWTSARTQVTLSRNQLTEAIVAAGGTP